MTVASPAHRSESPDLGRGGPAIRVEGVAKRFGETQALAGVDLEVPEGAVFGLLGPNGAGKTTLVRILSTLVPPDSGRAEILGHDVAQDPAAIREQIALTGQFAAVDELLTGRENLEMFGRLFDLSREETAERADRLLREFDLADAADRPARTYSGGMRRRLDLLLEPADAAPDPLPRRADHRARPPQPQPDLGCDPGPTAWGHHAALDHPVPGGGRSTRRADRGDRPRQGDRRGHGNELKEQSRRSDPRGRACGRGPARARSGGAHPGGLWGSRAGRASGPADDARPTTASS